MYTIPPLMHTVLREEILINEMVGNIPGGNFLGGNFPGEIFLEPSNRTFMTDSHYFSTVQMCRILNEHRRLTSTKSIICQVGVLLKRPTTNPPTNNPTTTYHLLTDHLPTNLY